MTTQSATTTEKPTVKKNFKFTRTQSKPRVWVRGRVLGYKRSLVKQYEHIALLQLEGVRDRDGAQWYAGKRVAYVYKAKNVGTGKNTLDGLKVIWGKITRPHGSSGTVRAKFSPNLPPSAISQPVRVFLYPSNI
ncbi:hypothetical protein ABK040_005340 [Willaertia magna]